MANANPPKRNQAFQVYVGVEDVSAPGRFKASPTIASGDWKISKDGGAFANLGTLPAVTPAAGRAVKIELTNTEMDADNVLIQGVDQTDPPEWADIILEINTTA